MASRACPHAGLSPRLRGNPWGTERGILRRGSIPAPAGEPSRTSRRRWLMRVYPRACGGTLEPPPKANQKAGLSPRLRGNLQLASCSPFCSGSIPAPAGEPPAGELFAFLFRVYPRACGGTPSMTVRMTELTGLSPRLRGNPPASPCTNHPVPVYPRACGGTRSAGRSRQSMMGLSPRLRGNPHFRDAKLYPMGSIPAPAGEPSPGSRERRLDRVYPRACGGTLLHFCKWIAATGLSPRLRGNQLPFPLGLIYLRSIPAPAGEPYRGCRSPVLSPVYPRACGGTMSLPGWP